jgi:replicative DNA helicase
VSAAPSYSHDVRRAAAVLRDRGFALCKPDPREKKPTAKGWSTRSLEPDAFGPNDQIGIIGGPLSDGNRPGHGLVILDLDSLEAVARADEFLPETGMVEGRPGKPRSHRYYLVPFDSIPAWALSQAQQAAAAAVVQKGHAGPFTKSFRHAETNNEVVKLIGAGAQAACPPSRHDSGERREWVGGQPGEPVVVLFLDLWAAVSDLAEACGAKRLTLDRPPPPSPRRVADSSDAVIRRAVAYLEKCPGAVSGQGGHSRTMGVARAIAYGFGLGEQVAYELLRDHYNPRCEPPWSEADLRHKAHDADVLPFSKPRGWLRDSEPPGAPRNGTSAKGTPAGYTQADHGDAYEGPENPTEAEPKAEPLFHFVSSAEFASRTYSREWLIEQVMATSQPTVIAGGFKTLKTSLMVEAALSIGTGRAFLGQFRVPRRRRVAVLSGESGEPTLQETAFRICKAKGIRLEDAWVFWEFKLPQLANAIQVRELQAALKACGAEVLLLDPLYLSLLAGTGGELSAANFYQTGPLLMGIGQACLEIDCTPALVHHFKTTRPNAYDEPQLEDLAYSGIKEYARQWILLGRREKYVPRSGDHKLWMSIGGSAGHSGLWAVDVNEGVVDDDFGGRTWDIKVMAAGDARNDELLRKGVEKAAKQEQQQRDDEVKLLKLLDKKDPNRKGYGLQRLCDHGPLPKGRMKAAAGRLVEESVLEYVEVQAEIGSGAVRPVAGIRRRGRGDD